MFEPLKSYRSILVTGPQRSGTRIIAKCIAHDTGYKYIDESYLGMFSGSVIRTHNILEGDGIIVQGPGVCHGCDEMEDLGNTLIVMCMRNIDDIIKSQGRINWRCEKSELGKYGLRHWEGPACAVKYDEWETQKQGIEHWLQVEYESMAIHPLWVDDREGWEWNQTENQ